MRSPLVAADLSLFFRAAMLYPLLRKALLSSRCFERNLSIPIIQVSVEKYFFS